MFDIFDSEKPVFRIQVTPGYAVQDGDLAGTWVPPAESSTTISGHISDLSLEERTVIDAGVLKKGARKFACDSSEGVQLGDVLEITERGETVRWHVLHVMYENALIEKYTGCGRVTYLISKP